MARLRNGAGRERIEEILQRGTEWSDVLESVEVDMEI